MMDALELLTDDDLAALAAALRSGRLHAPFTPVSLQQFCSPAHAGAMAIAATPRRRHEAGNFEADLLGVVQTAKQVDDCLDVLRRISMTAGVERARTDSPFRGA